MSGQSPHRGASVPPQSASRILAAHAASRQTAAMGAAAVARLRAFVFDTVSVGVAGMASPYASRVRQLARVGGDHAEATVWGFGDRLARRNAAFCNAFLAHCQEFDCVHEAAVLHPFTVVTPVLLAEAEATGLLSDDVFAAIAAGVDVASGLGVAATSPIKFFRPAVYGLFGAVAALCRARRLDGETAAHAFGYALAFASGTMQAHSEGTPALAIQIANAARCAFDAVDIAQAGLPGPIGAIDGPHGLMNLFETSHDLTRMLAPLADVVRAEEVSWKPYPTGRAAHGGLDMMRAAYAKGLRADDVATVEIIAPPLITHLVGRPIFAPLEINYARLCLPFLAAVMLRSGRLDLNSFTPHSLNDADIHALAARITISVNTVTDPAAFTPQAARLMMKNGAIHEESLSALPGSPARPLSLDEQIEKAARCFAFAFDDKDGGQGRAVRLRDLIDAPDGSIAWQALAACVSPN